MSQSHLLCHIHNVTAPVACHILMSQSYVTCHTDDTDDYVENNDRNVE